MPNVPLVCWAVPAEPLKDSARLAVALVVEIARLTIKDSARLELPRKVSDMATSARIRLLVADPLPVGPMPWIV